MNWVTLALIRSIKYSLIIAAVDALLGGVFFLIYGYETTVAVLSEVSILEVAFLFIIGGFFDVSQAQTTFEFRRMMGEKEVKYSAAKHLEAQKRGTAVVLAGVWLLILALGLSLML